MKVQGLNLHEGNHPSFMTHTNHWDPDEVHAFEGLAEQWWNPNGPHKALLALNPTRLDFIEKQCASKGSLLDLGCGGGLASIGLASRGFEVTGLDAGLKALQVARAKAKEHKVTASFVQGSALALPFQANSFDHVIALELAEHLPNFAGLLEQMSLTVKPGGSVIISTINRTPAAFAQLIVGAEYLLGVVPKGTHRYEKFILPSELDQAARLYGLQLQASKGLKYQPWSKKAHWSSDISTNYFMVWKKPVINQS